MSNEEVMSSYVEAWNAHDPVRVAGHFAADGVREWHVVQPPMIEGPTRFQGRADIAGRSDCVHDGGARHDRRDPHACGDGVGRDR